jgi:GT2 family glycosyltransferase
MRSTGPAVAVVVATRGRAALLPRLVDALAGQEVPGGFEAVVVDDASPDATWPTLARLAAEAPFPLRVLRLDRNAGPAAARNAGWRSSSAPVVAFTDDDCVPRPGWLAALLRAIDAGADLVQGRTVPDPGQLHRRRAFARTIETTAETGFYETCNMAYRRSVLEALGGFDERFRHPYGEDTDLAWRAKEAGYTSAFAADAEVWHDVVPSSFLARLRDSRRREGIVLAVARHPRLREVLDNPFFYRPTHPHALLAAAGTAAWLARPRSARRLAASLLAAAPYTWHRTRGREGIWCRKREWPLYVPAFLAADLADIAVLAWASLRHRTLLL